MPPRKRKQKEIQEVEQNEDNAEPEPAEKVPKKRAKKAKSAEDVDTGEVDGTEKPKNGKKTQPLVVVDSKDFVSTAKTTDGRLWNLKIASWNVNGVRAWLDKDGTSYIKAEDPDIFCLQELKCNTEKIPAAVKVEGYHCYWLSGEQEGYSGVGLCSKTKPVDVKYGLDIEKHDKEGRVITAEFEKFFMVTAYIPNAGRGLPRLPYRSKEWDVDFQAYIEKLDQTKPVILCGDLNVAHLEIDLKNPKTNKKNAGFTAEEREGFTNLLNAGFMDSFRELYPEQEQAYTFWGYFMNNRAKDCGWRLDYFVLSNRLKGDLCDNVIRKYVMGSDHCPIVLLMNMS